MKHAVISFLLSAFVLVSAGPAGAQEDRAREYIARGLQYASAGDTVLAFAEFEKALDVAPKLADAHFHLGRLYTHRASAVETDFKDRLKAEDALLEALRLNPSEPRYLLELARLRLKQHMRIDASRLFERALEEAEARGDADVLADVHFNIGYIKEIQYQALQHKRHMPFFRGPPSDRLTDVAGQFVHRYANDYMDASAEIEGSGRLYKEQMVEHYRAALRYDPTHVGAAVRLMGELLDQMRLGEYLALARRLKLAHPERPEPHLYMALGLHAAGREAEAGEAFDEGLGRLPDEQRAAVESLEQVMRRDDAELYRDMSEGERESFHKRYWRLTDPLLLTSANERRLEHLARVAYADLRFSAPEAGLRGWETDQGIIYVRYGPPEEVASFGPQTFDSGNPYAIGRRSIIWSYGEEGPVFVFRQMPGYLNARFAGDYKFIADNYRYAEPARYDNIPSIPELLDLPIQVARFRGEADDEVAVEIHAAPPLEDLAQGLDLERGEFEIGMFVLNSRGDRLVEETEAEVVNYAESSQVNEHRSWRLVLPPSGEVLTAAVETRDAVTWRAAAARDTFKSAGFPADSFAISDILLGDLIRPLTDDPKTRSDYDVFANAGLEYESGDPVHIYYEIYGLDEDDEGYAAFDVAIQLRVKKLERGEGLPALLGLLADAWGFSIQGDDRLELRFSRQVKMEGRDRVTEYLSLDPQELPAGEYEVRLRIWDQLAERMARQVRVFHVVEGS